MKKLFLFCLIVGLLYGASVSVLGSSNSNEPYAGSLIGLLEGASDAQAAPHNFTHPSAAIDIDPEVIGGEGGQGGSCVTPGHECSPGSPPAPCAGSPTGMCFCACVPYPGGSFCFWAYVY